MYIRQIFLIQMKYRLQSMHNHMVGRIASVVSPFYSLLPGQDCTESVLHICLLSGDSGLTYSILLLVNCCKCTVQLTEHTGRKLSYPLAIPLKFGMGTID